MPFRGAVFDLDGVIVDTAKYHFIAWQRLAKELGFEFTEEDNEELKGVSRMASLEILLKKGGLSFLEKEKEEMAQRKNEWYVEYITNMSKEEILPGSIRLLKELREKSVMTALATASRNADIILDRLEIRDLFDAIVDGNMVSKAKPDPEVFLKAAGLLSLPPNECVVFEDAAAGIEGAVRAGMKCIGIGDPRILAKAGKIAGGLDKIELSDINDLF